MGEIEELRVHFEGPLYPEGDGNETARRIANLLNATEELRKQPTPESIRAFWQAKIAHDGKRADYSVHVPKCDWTAEEVTRLNNEGKALIYIPDNLTPEILAKMYPEAQAVLVGVIENDERIKGWLAIEFSKDSPNLDLNVYDADELFAGQGRYGLTVLGYVLGSKMLHALTGYHFDEGETISRLNGSRMGIDKLPVCASHNADGILSIGQPFLKTKDPTLGARSAQAKYSQPSNILYDI